MELHDLTAEEEVCLMGLLREVIQADDDYSEPERVQVLEIRKALGDTRFDRAIDEAKKRYGASRAALKEHVKKITRPDARAVIYATLKKVAGSDGVTEGEEKPLKWLASWWDIEA